MAPHATVKPLLLFTLLAFVFIPSVTAKCPDICYPKKPGGKAKAKNDCKKVNAMHPDDPCSVKRCKALNEDGKVYKGFWCTCKDCKNACRPGMGGFRRAERECKDKDDDTCMMKPCITLKKKDGTVCGCPIKYKDCPKICRLKALGRLLAELECKRMPTCAATGRKCDVMDCKIGTKKGTMCGCREIPKKCPDSCHMGADAKAQAIDDCKDGPFDCVGGKCAVRSCWKGGEMGYGCRCDDPLNCPEKCRSIRDNGLELATRECNMNVMCHKTKKPCVVQNCTTERGEDGKECACRNMTSEPPTPSPTPSPSMSPSPSSSRNPLPKCPDSCHFGSNAKEMAMKECGRRLECMKGSCEVRKCFRAGRMGYGCRCMDPGSCPTICRALADGGLQRARVECDGNVMCYGLMKACEVQKCVTKGGDPGVQCGCPPPSPSPTSSPTPTRSPSPTPTKKCPNVCYILEKDAKRYCTPDLLCPERDEKCVIKRCSRGGVRHGYECTCEGTAEPCPNDCVTSPREMEQVKNNCTMKHYECPDSRLPCKPQSCTIGTRSGIRCGCSGSRPKCPDVCHWPSEVKDPEGLAKRDCTNSVCEETGGGCSIHRCVRTTLGRPPRSEIGYRCGCPTMLAKPCPDICRPGVDGEVQARNECARSRCRSGKECTVVKCPLRVVSRDVQEEARGDTEGSEAANVASEKVDIRPIPLTGHKCTCLERVPM